MTTPTREQVEALDAAAALAVCEKFGFEPSNAPHIKRSPEYATALVTLAMSAGRNQGLREAAAKVRAILADREQQDIDDPELEVIAAAIEQLRAPRAT